LVLSVSSLIPPGIVALAVYLLHRHQGMRLWHALVCLLAGASSPGLSSARTSPTSCRNSAAVISTERKEQPMITNLAATAASCTGTWSQRWNCGWNKPVSPAVAHAGFDFGHSLLPALAVVAVVLLIARAVRKKKARAAPAGAAARR
jgi:hypothetical protein